MAGSSNVELSKTSGRQFKATQTWNILVLHLKENVSIKKRRSARKNVDECFTGANAVDVLHQFVKIHPEQFKNASVTRENIVRLCQSFLDMNIVRRVMEDDVDKVDRFEDSSASLYAFIKDTNSCQSIGRQVLREIDGDIRNSLDHISISSENKQFPHKYSTLSFRSKKRPHFPSFGSHTLRSSAQSCDEAEGTFNDKVQHPMKRASTMVRRTVKRSTSDPNVHQSAAQTSSSDEEDERKSKKTGITRASVRLRFSQRLSFRKKSASFQQSELEGDCTKDTTDIEHRPKSPRFERGDKMRSNIVPKLMSFKPRRSLRRSSSLLSKIVSTSQSYDVKQMSEQKESQATVCSPAAISFQNKRRMNQLDAPLSPTKMMKKNVIKETPSRVKMSRQLNHGNAFTEFAHRVSLRRKSDRSAKSEESYVLRNPMTSDDTDQPKKLHNKMTDEAASRLHRECVRVRLLQLLDVSFVDDVICSPRAPSTESSDKQTTAYSCDELKHRFNDIASAYNSADPWVNSALNILRGLPSGCDVIEKHSRESDHDKKVSLFFSILKHYQSQPRPLIPGAMLKVVPDLIRVLESKPLVSSLEAVQLFIHLLPTRTIHQLRNLFTFLYYVTIDADVTISSLCNNKLFILQSFPHLLFSSDKNKHCDVASGPAGLVRLLVDKPFLAFTMPPTVLASIHTKRALIETGQITSPTMIRDNTYSFMMSAADFEEQKEEFTEKQLSDLAKYIASEASLLSSRKKKDFLKKLQSTHPTAYATLRQPIKANHMFSSESSKRFLKPPGTGTFSRRSKKNKDAQKNKELESKA